MKKIRVLVVDDSLFLRRTLPRLLEADPEIEVIGTAENGQEAIQMVKDLQPDVVTLDILMPVMDGLTALKHIMRENPVPVLIVSSVTQKGATTTLEALSLGAVDFVTKPSGPVSLDIAKVREELVQKVKVAYTAKIKTIAKVNVRGEEYQSLIQRLSSKPQPPVVVPEIDKTFQGKAVVAIAASTGGPAALQLILSQLPTNLQASVLIVQHIAPGFSRPLIERLDNLSPLTVREAQDGDRLRAGQVFVAPYGLHLKVMCQRGKLQVHLDPEPSNVLHRPSANELFNTLADCCGGVTCGVVLTGMGEDGAQGLQAIRQRGGYTIAQDEATSVIYGMPRRAMELNAADIVLPLERIAAEIIRVTATTLTEPSSSASLWLT
jgi:two-component system chemotaxis response regulator CheB